MIRRTEHHNHASAIVLNIEILIGFFCLFLFCLLEAAFKIHLAQKSEGARALNGHDGKYTFFIASRLVGTHGVTV